MKNNILFLVFILLSISANAQEDNFYSMMGYPKVVINKDLTAYTVSTSIKKNGVELPIETNNPSVSNPYYILIKSNKSNGSITIRNKNHTEDLIIDFQYIYKVKKENSVSYYFLRENKSLQVVYITEPGTNNTLMIRNKTDSDNDVTYFYTISRI